MRLEVSNVNILSEDDIREERQLLSDLLNADNQLHFIYCSESFKYSIFIDT